MGSCSVMQHLASHPCRGVAEGLGLCVLFGLRQLMVMTDDMRRASHVIWVPLVPKTLNPKLLAHVGHLGHDPPSKEDLHPKVRLFAGRPKPRVFHS